MKQLTANFDLKEFLLSATATRRGWAEQMQPPDTVVDNLWKLCVNVLQPVRDKLPGVMVITSGYRCERLNESVGSKPTSDHVKGMAADVNYYEGGEEKNLVLFDKVIELDLPFKQMIKEYGTAEKPAWIHLAYDEGNIKKQVFKIP
jgi:zinc D-Ala-D-Ala carboxypeptidase